MINIPVKDIEFYELNMFNTETGENLGRFDNIQEVNITSEFKREYARDKHENKIVAFNHEPTYTMTFDTDKPIDEEELYKILGVDTTKMPDSYDLYGIKYVQARKHKKRRINKKWLKRYGYKQVNFKSKGWKMKIDIDGNVEFVNRVCEISLENLFQGYREGEDIVDRQNNSKATFPEK